MVPPFHKGSTWHQCKPRDSCWGVKVPELLSPQQLRQYKSGLRAWIRQSHQGGEQPPSSPTVAGEAENLQQEIEHGVLSKQRAKTGPVERIGTRQPNFRTCTPVQS